MIRKTYVIERLTFYYVKPVETVGSKNFAWDGEEMALGALHSSLILLVFEND